MSSRLGGDLGRWRRGGVATEHLATSLRWYFIFIQSIGGLSPAPVNPPAGWKSDVTLLSFRVFAD